MYCSSSGMDQYSWSDIPEMPYIFSCSSPTPSDSSRGTPQIQPNLYDSTSTSFDENRFRSSQTFYAPPCASISPPLITGDVSDAFNSSHIYSANISLPHTGQNQPRPPFVFGDIQSPFAFNIDHFWPTPAYEINPPARVASLSVPYPPAPSTDQASFSPSSQLGEPDYLACLAPSKTASESTPGSTACKEGSQVPTVPPRSPPLQQSSARSSSKKRKTSQSDGDDKSVGAPLNSPQQMLKLPGRQRPCFNAA